jgi:GNAT superfamily N-acetyltransferase
MALRIHAVTSDLMDDVGQLFQTDSIVRACWCMWFIIPVKEYHALGEEGNHAAFCALHAASSYPLGLLAYAHDEPVGWCAVGPRARYERAMRTPTYRDAAAEAEANIWLVPCFYVRKDKRRTGISRALLEAAVQHAKANGATAIDGFPLSKPARRASGDHQVGTAALFLSCGFSTIHTPSASRLVMRRDLTQ